MSKIFELYGYRLDSWSEEAAENCSKAWCPFMDAECDGGGNRYSSALNLSANPRLAEKFPGKTVVQSGVCSLAIKEGEQPWIVCPRRLLTLKQKAVEIPDYQSMVKSELRKYIGDDGSPLRIWSEVKMKIGMNSGEIQGKVFDYTFDYVISGQQRILLKDVANIISKSESQVQKIAEQNGYTLALRNNEVWIEDFPSDPICIVEIMTSSTSGGDKNKRTQISMACEDAILDPANHNGPGINYRQVWARMVSQLIVKSQVGMAWGGITFWLIQDVLADYISNSTALDLSAFFSDTTNEVNILSFGYGDAIRKTDSRLIMELNEASLYSGPIDSHEQGLEKRSGFVDIVKIGAPPSKSNLWRSLFLKQPCGSFS